MKHEEVPSCDEGLVPMLRTGMLALQLLPSNCLAGIVIFTDGCSDVYSASQIRIDLGITVPGELSICDILAKLRCQTISCSFVQAVRSSPFHSFGNVPNDHLLKFISAATGGFYVCLDYEVRHNWPPPWWKAEPGILNPLARGLFSWSFQKGINCSRYLPDSDIYWDVSDVIRKWHRTYPMSENLSYSREIIENKQIILFEKEERKRKVNVPLHRVVACHLREG